MKAKKKQAASGKTARNNKQQNTDYQVPFIRSRANLKMTLAELLFYLQKPLNQTVKQTCWNDFESMLCIYYEGVQR